MQLDLKKVREIVRIALAEDIGTDDITTKSIFSPTEVAQAKIVAKDNCIISGLAVAREVFKTLDKKCIWRAKYKDGVKVKAKRTVATVRGRAHAILSGERTALNFLSEMSGIATLTNKFVNKVKKYNIEIFDTRKTSPGLRMIEKYAVTCGGGKNHRMGLYDMILVKDNHIRLCRQRKIPIAQVLNSLRGRILRGTKIEFEAQSLRDVELALNSELDIIMLDNMDYKTLKKAIKMIRKSKKDVIIEISGGINLKNIEKIAKLRPDRISLGEITNSAPAIDFSLEII
ncbi:MAG: carboxylating nicotinate-nucleotide diphosphorylase [Endomicrobiia bacterium]